ncbi:hypothetical protein [Marinigracilibium pacificum]|uniref:DUF3299 domain-containing protein n=1 Tax=Marinigracilibium pacificum TaxID=2729599 RepID=A0A848JBZ0_9BACT|nr:hypothetical protein [Marinigracilibium pacificum]NMM50522.1 hypothetical protein [Marinigracilibium pacificum]
MRKTIYCLFILCFSVCLFGQNKLNYWNVLSAVTFQTGYSNGSDIPFDIPVFSEKLNAIDGKEIELEGYILPVEVGKSGHYILSKLPFNVCYYCGGAGPETIVEIISEKELEPLETKVKISGTLKLNDHDMNYHMYILNNSKLVE